jgi:hypothetical protein
MMREILQGMLYDGNFSFVIALQGFVLIALNLLVLRRTSGTERNYNVQNGSENEP